MKTYLICTLINISRRCIPCQLFSSQVPHFNPSIFETSTYIVPIRMKLNACDWLVCSQASNWWFKILIFPNMQSCVSRSSSNQTIIIWKSNRAHSRRKSLLRATNILEFHTRHLIRSLPNHLYHTPQLDFLIIRSRDQVLPIIWKSNFSNRPTMSRLDFSHHTFLLRTPYLQSAVLTPSSQELVLWMALHCVRPLRSFKLHRPDISIKQIPPLNQPILRRWEAKVTKH